MKALNSITIHETPVGLVACLPPNPPPFVDKELDAAYCADLRGFVFGVVTKCERCGGTGRYGIVGPPCGHCHDDVQDRLFGGGVKSGTGYAPLKFVKVLAVWPIQYHGYHDTGARPSVMVENCAEPRRRWLADKFVPSVLLDLPDAEPGGVALHVEWTDCPTCWGVGGINHDEVGRGEWCPTCRTPPTVEGDGPIVEVAT